MSSRKAGVHIFWLMALTVVSSLGISCGKKINLGPSITDYLPDQTASGLQRTTEVRQYDRETLWEHLNGGADLYLDQGFTRMATADYRVRDLQFTADIFGFDSPEAAGKLYAIIRPPDVLKDIDIGQAGYLDPGQLTFVRGSYLVRLTGYIDTTESQELLVDLAKAVLGRMQVQQDGRSD